MNTFTTDENQVMLAESARKYVERGYTATARAASLVSAHGCSAQRWQEFADMGWLALSIPEADGGLGGSLADMCVLAEELGHALVVEPLIASGVMATTLLTATGNAVQRDHWLPAIAAGEKRVAFAAWEPQGRFDATQVKTRAERIDGGYRLNGVKELAVGASGADAIIVCALCQTPGQAPEPALFLIDSTTAGLEIQSYAMVDGRHAAHLRMTDMIVAADKRLDAADAMQAIGLAIDQTIIVLCAETTGVMANALKTTIDYLKARKQFGRILSTNQALQHRLVDMHVAIEETRALVYAAAQAFTGPELQRQAYVAATKAYTSQAARLLWEEVVQMHGAIGLTDEYMLGRYVKHLATAHILFGDTEQHLERLSAVDDQLYAHKVQGEKVCS